jgi:hypothetical protein
VIHERTLEKMVDGAEDAIDAPVKGVACGGTEASGAGVCTAEGEPTAAAAAAAVRTSSGVASCAWSKVAAPTIVYAGVPGTRAAARFADGTSCRGVLAADGPGVAPALPTRTADAGAAFSMLLRFNNVQPPLQINRLAGHRKFGNLHAHVHEDAVGTLAVQTRTLTSP